MTHAPLDFSISVPVGAWHPFLRDCFSSLAVQEGPLEVALLDASGDPRVADTANDFNDLFAYRRHGPDGGQSDAIIEGWKKTSGAILGWLNADDLLFPGALTAAREAFANNPEFSLVYGHSTIVDRDKRTIGYHWAVEPPGDRILEGGIISQPSCFFRREAYDAIGGLNAGLHYTMDWDLWIRLYKSGAKFGFIDDVLSMVLWGDGTKTSSFNKQRREELLRIIAEHAPPAVARKTMRSFAIHNAVDRIPLRSLQKLITRGLIRGRRQIRGIGGDGLIDDGAELSFAHYDSVPKSGLMITADGAGAIESADINGASAKIEHLSAKALKVTANTPIEAATPVSLRLHKKVSGTAYFLSAGWIEMGAD